MSKTALMRQLQEIAHVDVNCFYASAERACDPSLEGKPLIVLSNNDGCAVTRSPEANALGIGIGEPWFKIAPRAKELLVCGAIRKRRYCGPVAAAQSLRPAEYKSLDRQIVVCQRSYGSADKVARNDVCKATYARSRVVRYLMSEASQLPRVSTSGASNV